MKGLMGLPSPAGHDPFIHDRPVSAQAIAVRSWPGLWNAAAQLGAAFGLVTRVRPPRQPVVIRDATVAADYVASHHQDEIPVPGRMSSRRFARRSRP